MTSMKKVMIFSVTMLAAIVFGVIGYYILAWPNLGLAAAVAVVGAFLVHAVETKP